MKPPLPSLDASDLSPAALTHARKLFVVYRSAGWGEWDSAYKAIRDARCGLFMRAIKPDPPREVVGQGKLF